jgi:hypothetical protein
MTIANISSLTTQVVTQNALASPGGFGVTALLAQVVTETEPARVFVSEVVSQVIQTSIPRRYIVSEHVAQVIVKNSSTTGGVIRVSEQFPQVVYTTGSNDQPRQRAWTFDFDGHVFYCLDMGESGCLVFDTTTGSWTRWNTTGYDGHFNFKNGFHWRGGKQVVGGGLLDGLILSLDPTKVLDEDFKPIKYEIQGVVFFTSEDVIRQYSLRMIGSPGRTYLEDDLDPPILRMQFSDDNGNSWSTEKTITLTQDAEQRLQFRSLGRMKQPGRIFRLYDDGGIKFIATVVADVEGE